MILFLGSGFIANALSASMMQQNIPHRIVSREIEDVPPGRIRADVATLDEGSSVFDDVSTAIYFAHSSVPFSSMQNIRVDAQENILNAISLFEIFAKRNIRVIYVSSGGSVYGNQEGVVSEAALPSPISAYGTSKYTIENYLKLFHHNYALPYDILRFSNVYGVGQQANRPQGVVFALARAFVGKHSFEIWGDGSAEKDYLYIDDAAAALSKVAAASASNDTFNVSNGRSISLREIISLFEDRFGHEIEIRQRPAFSFDVHDVHLNNEKFCKAYDWSPTVDIGMGIEKTVEWLASQPGDV